MLFDASISRSTLTVPASDVGDDTCNTAATMACLHAR